MESDHNKRSRTVVMRNPYDVPIMKSLTVIQDSYDVLTPSTDPQHLIGSQPNPEVREQQKDQRRAKGTTQTPQ